MHDVFPIANGQDASGKHPRAAIAEDSDIGMAVRQLFRPYVLAFLALAVAVGGWSYGYKLSQYLGNSGVTKASATRMWVDHRDESVIAPAQHPRPHRLISPQFWGLSIPQLPHLSRELVFRSPIEARVTVFVSPLHPLRAPPTSITSLA